MKKKIRAQLGLRNEETLSQKKKKAVQEQGRGEESEEYDTSEGRVRLVPFAFCFVLPSVFLKRYTSQGRFLGGHLNFHAEERQKN